MTHSEGIRTGVTWIVGRAEQTIAQSPLLLISFVVGVVFVPSSAVFSDVDHQEVVSICVPS